MFEILLISALLLNLLTCSCVISDKHETGGSSAFHCLEQVLDDLLSLSQLMTSSDYRSRMEKYEEILTFMIQLDQRRQPIFSPDVLHELGQKLKALRLESESNNNVLPSQLKLPPPVKGQTTGNLTPAVVNKNEDKTGEDKETMFRRTMVAELDRIAAMLKDVMMRAEKEWGKIVDQENDLRITGLELRILMLKGEIVERKLVAIERKVSNNQ